MEFLIKSRLFFLSAFIVFNLINPIQTNAQSGASVSFQTFYDELEPYGRWVNDPEYGYIWSPDAEPDFHPYVTRGHWVVTNYGNTWISDYPWGWAPFHYGRWSYSDYYGWFWVPDYEWGPAWVSWRSGGEYYGWAPLPPRSGIHISVNIPLVRWIFVPSRYITHYRVYDYCIPRTRIRTIYRNTHYLDNYYERNNRRYVYGPRPRDIEHATRSRVVVRNIQETSRPQRVVVNNNSVKIYRPEVNRDDRNNSRPARVWNNTSRNETLADRPELKNSNERTERNTADNRAQRPSRNTDNHRNSPVQVDNSQRETRPAVTSRPERVSRERERREQQPQENRSIERERRPSQPERIQQNTPPRQEQKQNENRREDRESRPSQPARSSSGRPQRG
ncbi:DUF6600 domain-containing protein [Rubrolithibacter danxiaensis]|uniref:DUF6600 domain-containing protein n=1 Tax=Rubrolithibacter danxiaensis TaxID=3390805 RepID=UPI003BF8CC04